MVRKLRAGCPLETVQYVPGQAQHNILHVPTNPDWQKNSIFAMEIYEPDYIVSPVEHVSKQYVPKSEHIYE